jgi:hypothetical protein
MAALRSLIFCIRAPVGASWVSTEKASDAYEPARPTRSKMSSSSRIAPARPAASSPATLPR